MTASEILIPAGGAGFLIVILGLIKIKPLEISVWSWLFRKIGKAFNGETLDRLEAMEKKLDGHIKGDREDKILQIRQRILRFADEMYQGIYHSKEHFEEILRQARVYELYCDENPEFENGKTAPAIELIKAQYKECLEKHSFERRSENEGNGTEKTHEGDRGLSQLQVPGGMAV